jgi:hypothetical protein
MDIRTTPRTAALWPAAQEAARRPRAVNTAKWREIVAGRQKQTYAGACSDHAGSGYALEVLEEVLAWRALLTARP